VKLKSSNKILLVILILVIAFLGAFSLLKFTKPILIETAGYDKDCNVQMTLSNKEIIKLQTYVNKIQAFYCPKTLPILISLDKKTVAFQGSNWINDSTEAGNYLGIYFLSQKDYVNAWGIGAAEITNLVFNQNEDLIAKGIYSSDKSQTTLTFKIKKIEQDFKKAVDPVTKKLINQEGYWEN
jgi:hypothetical protein